MTNEQEPKPNKPIKGGPPERFNPRWMLIVLAIFTFIVIVSMNRSPMAVNPIENWTIQRVLNEARRGEVVKGVIKSDSNGGPSWYVISGEAKAPATAEGVASKLSGSQQTAHSNRPKLSEMLAAKRKDNGAAAAAAKKPNTIRFRAEGRLTEERFNELMEAYNFKEEPASTFLKSIIITLLPFMLIMLLLYFLFIRQIRMAGKGAMSFGKSRARLLTRDKERVTFRQVAGCDEAKEEVEEIVEFLKDPKKFQKIGGRIPKGVLMVGPPGTGKTLLARAVAGEADVPFFSISGSDFVEMFVGVGAARVRDMFEQGRKNAPCLVFIDEIDAVGRQRGAGLGGGNDEREQTLNSLLVEMDGFDGHEGVIIIAATNRPDVLDNALLRPGRFDRQITIDLPDIKGREEILKVHAKKITLDDNVDLAIVARNSSGFSGADLENLLNEGALVAARRNKDAVEMVDIDEAREKISFGRERRRLMDDEDKKITAYHEAGHALVAAVIKDDRLPVHKVTIIPRGQSLGSTMFMPKKDILNYPKNHLLNQICWGMGGRLAEEIVLGEITSGASGDIKMVTKMARHMVCDWGMSPMGPVAYGDNQDHVFLGKEISRDQNFSEKTAQQIDQEIHRIIEEQYERARKILTENKDSLDKVAQALLKYETIEGKHVNEILSHGEIRSEVIFNPPTVPKSSLPEEEEKDEKADEKKPNGNELGPSPEGAPA